MKKIIGILLAVYMFPFLLDGQNVYENSDDFDQRFYNARFVFHKTCFEEAFQSFESLKKERPEQALSHAYASMIDMLLFKDPADNIQKAISISQETDSDHLFVLALCSFALGDYSDCELKLNSYLKDNPNDSFAWHVLGFTQIDQGRPQDGKNTLDKLLQIHPDYYPAYNHLGYAYLKLGEPKNAIESFENFLHADESNPSAHDSYAEGLVAIKEYDRAITHLTRAVLLEPKFAYGWNHMGDIFKESGENTLAGKAYEKAISSAILYGEDFISYVNKKIESLK